MSGRPAASQQNLAKVLKIQCFTQDERLHPGINLRFTSVTTKPEWLHLENGVIIGCFIKVFLIVLVMNMLVNL